MRKLFILIAICLSTTAWAQTTIELTPTLGYRWGGEISARSNDIFDRDVDVNSDVSAGLMVGIPLNRWLELELMVDHQSTTLGDSGLWQPSNPASDIDLTYYHAGLLFQWHAGDLRPYVVGSLGITDLDLSAPGAGSDGRFSAALGGGLKVDLSRHIGLRLEMRGFWTDTTSGSWWDCDDCDWSWDDDCDDWDHCWEGNTDLVQAELKVGVIFKF